MTFRLKDFLRILRIFFRILRIWRWNTTWIHKLTSYLAALPSHKQWWKILQVSLRGLHAAPFRQFQKTTEDTFHKSTNWHDVSSSKAGFTFYVVIYPHIQRWSSFHHRFTNEPTAFNMDFHKVDLSGMSIRWASFSGFLPQNARIWESLQ